MKKHQIQWGLLIVFFAVVCASWVLPSMRSRTNWHTSDRRSLVQLRSVAQGCIVYAANNNDQLPDISQWRELLIEQDINYPDEFLSPGRITEAMEDSYIMAHNATMWDERSILLYENPDHWEDFVNVAFGDASTEQLAHDEFERRLAEQLHEE